MAKKILLVEYDESTIHFIKEILPPPAFEMVVAAEGETAQKLLESGNFDMMITAAMLPRFHGFNLALAVAKNYPEVKIIIISAIYKGLEYRHQAITQYRANEFFEKPLEKEKFKKRVLELLNMSAQDLETAAHADATRVPVFDTARIPAPDFSDNEENKLSSADIFGDIIQNIDKVPEFQIDLGNKPPAPAPAPKKAEPQRIDPRPAAMPPNVPAPKIESKKADPGKTQLLTSRFDLDSIMGNNKADPGRILIPKVADSRKVAASTQKISDSLDSLRQKPKSEAPDAGKMRKIEDDIARRFDDTLSGLGIRRPTTPAKPTERHAERAIPIPMQKPVEKAIEKPVVKPVVQVALEPPAPAPIREIQVKEEEKSLEDEIIELGEDILQKPEPEAAAPIVSRVDAKREVLSIPEAKEVKFVPEVKEARPEKKPLSEENPNEVGDYQLLGLIARGGMAEIYKAKKKGVKGFEKVIAIKKILSGYGEDDKYIEMLVDEAKIAAELSHPNIVQIYDLGRKDNYYFIAMEYVLGKDLREIQTRLRERDKWFPEEIALYLIVKILEALNYAHKAKDSRGRPLEIVHRDVSPPNILIAYNGEVKLTDFGVSKASIKIHQTLSGALKGKLLYMSPEQARGESTIDFRSDLYSAGILLFELLTGKKLFLDTSEMVVLKRVQNGEIINPREINPDIDSALEKIILTSLSKDCDKRYQSAAAMSSDLEAYMHRKYDYIPGPVHLSHFIYDLFETDIQREGIKVDLKPIPPKPRLREIPKPQPPPEAVKPKVETHFAPSAASKPLVPPPPPAAKPLVPAKAREMEGVVQINFDDEPAPQYEKKQVHKDNAPILHDSIFKELEKEKKKFPMALAAAGLVIVGVAAALYFLVFNKPAQVTPSALKSPVGQEGMNAGTPAGPQAASMTPAVDKAAADAAAAWKLLDDTKRKQEEDMKALQAEEDKKKLKEEKRKNQEDLAILKKTEDDRVKTEEATRLQKEEEDQKNQEEATRLQKEQEERKKAEELKRAEQLRVKEGDIISMSDVDTPPVVVSTPDPSIPPTLRKSMLGDQAFLFTMLINQNGDVEKVRLLQKSSLNQLNIIMTDVIKTWKYQPARKNNVRVKVWKTVSMTIKK